MVTSPAWNRPAPGVLFSGAEDERGGVHKATARKATRDHVCFNWLFLTGRAQVV